jgi:hypothetical protein
MSETGQNEPSKHVRSGGSFRQKRPWRLRFQDRALWTKLRSCEPRASEAVMMSIIF